MNPLHELLEDLEESLGLLKHAGECYHEDDIDGMLVQLASLSSRLQYAIRDLNHIVERRFENEALNVVQLDKDLSGVDMTWGITRTPEGAGIVADDTCMVRRHVCDEEFLSQIEASRERVDATEAGVEKAWEEATEEPRSLLKWRGVENDTAVFRFGNGDLLKVDASRLAALRALTLFDRAEFSHSGKESVVFFHSNDPTPVAIMLI